jgi:hypothetical protein
MTAATQQIRLGLRANWQQFALLVVINAFVGAMVGIERAIVPLLAAEDFDQTSRTVILSFIISFWRRESARQPVRRPHERPYWS